MLVLAKISSDCVYALPDELRVLNYFSRHVLKTQLELLKLVETY